MKNNFIPSFKPHPSDALLGNRPDSPYYRDPTTFQIKVVPVIQKIDKIQFITFTEGYRQNKDDPHCEVERPKGIHGNKFADLVIHVPILKHPIIANRSKDQPSLIYASCEDRSVDERIIVNSYSSYDFLKKLILLIYGDKT